MRQRRSNETLDAICDGCNLVISKEGRVSLRHLFYKLVGMKLLEKNEAEYGKLSKYTIKWRREGRIDWEDFVDTTRWYHGDTLFDNIEECLQNSQQTYRRNLWNAQDAHVEIWVEKEAIAAIIEEAARPFGVRCFPMHGYASGSALYSISKMNKYMKSIGKEVFIYYLGDHDPHGIKIQTAFINSLKEDFDCTFHFHRIGVTPEQIRRYNLPTRPKKKTDPASFVGECIEVDALDNEVIENLVTNCITQHIDEVQWKRELEFEQYERDCANLLLKDL